MVFLIFLYTSELSKLTLRHTDSWNKQTEINTKTIPAKDCGGIMKIRPRAQGSKIKSMFTITLNSTAKMF